MHIIGIHKVLWGFFHGVKSPGYRDLNKRQIPTHPGLNSCQMTRSCPGGGGGGMGTLGFDLYITTKNSQQQHLPHIGKSSARKGKKEKQSLAKKLLHVVWKNMKKLFR